MKAIRIENLRSIVDSGYIDIKPINILLGKNSSGKSSFLRTFPLLKQSVSKNLRGPLLWFENNSVDFGNFETAKNNSAKDTDYIKFGFKVSLSKKAKNYYRYSYNRYNSLDFKDDIYLKLYISSDTKGAFIAAIKIIINDNTIKLSSPKRDSSIQITINNNDLLNHDNLKWYYPNNYGVIPSIINSKNKLNSTDIQFDFMHKLVDKIKENCSSRLENTSKIFSIINEVKDISDHSFLEKIKKQMIIKSLAKNAKYWTTDSKEFLNIYHLWILGLTPNILNQMNDHIRDFFSQVKYIAPSRAEALRFYRNQELSVSEVDAYGKNLQEFIASLTSEETESLQSFTQQSLGSKIKVENSSSHQSIYLIDKSEKSYNLTDVGFGYSQILPIIVVLWQTIYKPTIYDRFLRKNKKTCIVIEQPELHLHPAMQARIADIFIKAVKLAKENDIELSLIIETHSSTIINRLGRRIRERECSSNDIQVLLFDKDIYESHTQISTANYNHKGQLQNWPLGFFEPEND